MFDARSRYVAAAVQTASPARLLTMLVDRLVLDVERGAHALTEGRRADATQHLAHAQDIVTELAASRNVTSAGTRRSASAAATASAEPSAGSSARPATASTSPAGAAATSAVSVGASAASTS